jgi:hypothetical protein
MADLAALVCWGGDALGDMWSATGPLTGATSGVWNTADDLQYWSPTELITPAVDWRPLADRMALAMTCRAAFAFHRPLLRPVLVILARVLRRTGAMAMPPPPAPDQPRPSSPMAVCREWARWLRGQPPLPRPVPPAPPPPTPDFLNLLALVFWTQPAPQWELRDTKEARHFNAAVRRPPTTLSSSSRRLAMAWGVAGGLPPEVFLDRDLIDVILASGSVELGAQARDQSPYWSIKYVLRRGALPIVAGELVDIDTRVPDVELMDAAAQNPDARVFPWVQAMCVLRLVRSRHQVPGWRKSLRPDHNAHVVAGGRVFRDATDDGLAFDVWRTQHPGAPSLPLYVDPDSRVEVLIAPDALLLHVHASGAPDDVRRWADDRPVTLVGRVGMHCYYRLPFAPTPRTPNVFVARERALRRAPWPPWLLAVDYDVTCPALV